MCNLNIKAEGTNEHHKIEAIFKAFAKSIKMAIRRDGSTNTLPSTKGSILNSMQIAIVKYNAGNYSFSRKRLKSPWS